jgi:hypothetical protein
VKGSLAKVSICFMTLVILVVNLGETRAEEQNLAIYDSDFFSIKYPSSWHISSEPWITSAPGESGVILKNSQKDTNHGSRITPHSNMGYSIIIVTSVPKSSLFGSSDLSGLELVDFFVDFAFSEERLGYYGAQLIADNYTSVSGIQARSVTYTTGGYYNLVVSTADDSNFYQISYVCQESKYQEELPEVLSIISSFRIEGTTDTGNLI